MTYINASQVATSGLWTSLGWYVTQGWEQHCRRGCWHSEGRLPCSALRSPSGDSDQPPALGAEQGGKIICSRRLYQPGLWRWPWTSGSELSAGPLTLLATRRSLPILAQDLLVTGWQQVSQRTTNRLLVWQELLPIFTFSQIFISHRELPAVAASR